MIEFFDMQQRVSYLIFNIEKPNRFPNNLIFSLM